MRQLLIVALDSPDPIDRDFLAIHVPRLIQNAKGSGEVLNSPFTRKDVKEAVERCMEGLVEGEYNVSIFPELSRGEAAVMGLRMLCDLVPALEGLDEVMRMQRRPSDAITRRAD